MKTPEEIAQLRIKMIEHLEAALALADKTRDGLTGYIIQTALDTIRAASWSVNFDLLPPDLSRYASFGEKHGLASTV